MLALLEPLEFSAFLESLGGEISDILKIDYLKLCLESKTADHAVQSRLAEEYGRVLGIYAPGSIEEYLTAGRSASSRIVTLRQVANPSETLYGDKAPWIKSEALLKLDLGVGRLPGMLAIGSESLHQFHPSQATDLLAFFAGAAERALRRWLD